MKWLVQTLAHLLAPTAQQFQQALAFPKKAQSRVQAEIIKQLIDSEYGQSLGVRSPADWQRVPIVDYSDIAHWIDRQQTSNTSLLTSDPVCFYEQTSGTNGPAKWIPYTQDLRRSFSQLFCIWAHDLICNGPELRGGQVYFCVSPQLGKTSDSDEDPSIGLADDSEYLDPWLRALLRPFLVSPPGINYLQDPEEFKEQLCLTLLQAKRLEILSIWSPSFLTVLLNYIHTHRKRLQKQLRHRISDRRWQLLAQSPIPWTELWPQLSLISCWDSVYAADRAQDLRAQFPGVLVQGKGLLATEAPMTVPLIPAKGCVPMLTEVFFEFEDAAGNVRLLHELEIGQVYSIVLSQNGGLYRYRIGDRVRATHLFKQTPCLEFLGRTAATSDLVGEKLHADFVATVLQTLGLETSAFCCLAPTSYPSDGYVLLLDRLSPTADTEQQQDRLEVDLDEALSKSPQYRQARLLGQLTPARVIVSHQIAAWLIANGLSTGQRWGNLKHQILHNQPLTSEQILELTSLARLTSLSNISAA
ncbi:MAG: GH3 auxin-responsive promoter family protein [Cyanobacteria bacterium P01_E01_bin.34]